MTSLDVALNGFPSLVARGLTARVLRKYGVYTDSSGQLYIPLHDPFGRNVGVLIRTRHSDLKYISHPPNAKSYLFNFYFDFSCSGDIIVLFESPFDVMAVDFSAIICCAVIGVKLSSDALDSLIGGGCKRIVLAFDEDTTGQMAMLRLAPRLVSNGFMVGVYRRNLSIVEDYDFVVERMMRLSKPGFVLF